MKINQLFAFLFLGCFAVLSCENRSEKDSLGTTLPDDLESKIDSIATEFLNTEKVLGFSIAIFKADQEIYHNSFGFIDTLKSERVTTSTTFPIASVTKPTTALVAMQLVEEGLFDLEDNVVDLLPNFPKLEFANQLKIKHLLNHTSGLPNDIEYVDSLYISGKENITLSDYYDSFRGHQLFEPGTKFAYSNIAFSIMTEIMKKVSGLTYRELIKKYISEPHGLSSIDMQFNNIEKGIATTPFELGDSTYFSSPINPLYGYMEGDGGLSATAADLAKLIIAFKNGTIVNTANVTIMTTPAKLSADVIADYGLGFRLGYLENHKVYGHTGGHKTTWSVMSYFPEDDISIAAVVNTDRTSSNALEIYGAVAVACMNIEINPLSTIEVPINDVDAFVGDYIRPIDTPERFMQIVTYPDDKNLYRKTNTSQSKGERIYHLGNDQFAPESAPMDRLIFARNQSGEVTHFNEYYNGLFIGIREKKTNGYEK